jgi:hypothetical protein
MDTPNMHLWQLTMIFSADTVTTTLSSPLNENAASGTALPGEGLELRFSVWVYSPGKHSSFVPQLRRLAPERC